MIEGLRKHQAFPSDTDYGMSYHQWLVGTIAAAITDDYWHDGSYDAAKIAACAVGVADEICKRLEGDNP